MPDPSTTVSYTYTTATAEPKWRSFTGTWWWRDAGGRANFCVGRSKCDKSPKSILWRWHDRSTLLLTSQSVFLSTPPLVHSWLVSVVLFAAICVQHFPAGCMYCRHGIYVGGTHCNRCAWSSSGFISSPHCHGILGCCHLKEGWFWSSWKAILGPQSLGHEIDGMHAVQGTGYRCCTNSSILMTRFWHELQCAMQRESVARVADVIQIPAFLCQQVRTSLSAAYYQATGFLQIWRVLTPFFVSNLLKVNVDLADLLIAAAKTRRVINIKNGQFCASSVSHSIFK